MKLIPEIQKMADRTAARILRNYWNGDVYAARKAYECCSSVRERILVDRKFANTLHPEMHHSLLAGLTGRAYQRLDSTVSDIWRGVEIAGRWAPRIVEMYDKGQRANAHRMYMNIADRLVGDDRIMEAALHKSGNGHTREMLNYFDRPLERANPSEKAA